MVKFEAKDPWQIAGGQVTGPTHTRRGVPCQDALDWKALENGFVVAVADGHGSSASPRSDVGSRLAVECAIEVLSRILGEDPSLRHLETERLKHRLAHAIAGEWRQRVKSHYLNHGGELADDEDLSTRQLILYGTTMLALAVTDDWAVATQIGDGELVTVEPPHWLWPRDHRLGNETESLCQEAAVSKFHLKKLEVGQDVPKAFLLCTDGVYNAFQEDEDFLKLTSDLSAIQESEGLEYLGEHLESWLMEFADASGDDATLACVFRNLPAGQLLPGPLSLLSRPPAP